MMTYDYDPVANVIHLRATGVLVKGDPITYFHAIAKDPSIKPDAIERVYFQNLDDIAFSYSDIESIRDTFGRLEHDKRLAYTVFLVDSDFSYGMARMIKGIFGHPTHEFRIERTDRPNDKESVSSEQS